MKSLLLNWGEGGVYVLIYFKVVDKLWRIAAGRETDLQRVEGRSLGHLRGYKTFRHCFLEFPHSHFSTFFQ